VGALIGLDARAALQTPNGLGTYARQLTRALVELDADNSYIVIRRPRAGPPIVTGPRERSRCTTAC